MRIRVIVCDDGYWWDLEGVDDSLLTVCVMN